VARFYRVVCLLIDLLVLSGRRDHSNHVEIVVCAGKTSSCVDLVSCWDVRAHGAL
jgi:hypothetical protein